MTATPQDAKLLSRFAAAGGGASSFKAETFIDSLTVSDPNEKTRLETLFGADRMATPSIVFDDTIAMSLKGEPIAAKTMPGSDLAVALYRATALLEDVGKTSEMTATNLPTPMAMSSSTPMQMQTGSPTSTPSPMASGMPMPMASGMPMQMGSPMPMSSATSTHDTSGMKMTDTMAMKSNANGVMSMHGSSKMGMDMTAMSMRMMAAVTDLGVPMSREGSGTAWLPDSSTTFGHMSMSGDNMLMTHGAGFVRYSDTFGDRGSRTFNAPDWYMAMGTHPLSSASQLGARIMVTSDFATVGGYGYPELFQTGESYHGQALHDHQHPHDLFSEAALTYSTQMSHDASAFVYVGYPGEPALGPPTYMHRLIAYDMPDAPIGHHWEDSTHITFGVVTAGVTIKNVKLEASTFTGREPNEIRTNFDRIDLNSASGRVSWNPTANLATQISYGYVKSPEALTPDLNQHRTTASIIYNEPLGLGQFLTASTVWGQNYESDGARSNAYLIEADYHRRSDSIYSRAEFVQKSGNELVLNADPTQLAGSPSLTQTVFPIGAYTIGYVHDSNITAGSVMGLGGQVTFNTRPSSLDTFYGPQTPWGFELFARFRPTAMR